MIYFVPIFYMPDLMNEIVSDVTSYGLPGLMYLCITVMILLFIREIIRDQKKTNGK